MKPNNLLKTGFSILIICLLLTPLILGSEPRSFVVGVEDFEASPPCSQYSNGEYKGFNRELSDLFAKTKGHVFRYKAYPLKRLNHNFPKNGGLDLKYPDNPYWAPHCKEGILDKPNALAFDRKLPFIRSFRYLASVNHPDLIHEFNRFLSEKREIIDHLSRKHRVEYF